MSSENRALYTRAVFGIGCIVAGVVAGQMVDQRLMLVAMFPAVTLLSGVIARITAPRPRKSEKAEEPPLSATERSLLALVWNAGELGSSKASERAALSEEEAANALSRLAERGYLSARESDGAVVYSRARR